MSDAVWRELGLGAQACRALTVTGFHGPAGLVGKSAEALLDLHGLGRTAIVILAPDLGSEQPQYSVDQVWHA